MPLRLRAILFCTLIFAAPAGAATCGGDFHVFLSAMSRGAAAAGISRAVIDSAFAGVTPDGAVLAFDRRQRGTFRMSFEHYAATRVIPARIKRAKHLMQRHAALLARIEQQFGVPAALLMAIWTLETDNGTGDMGKLPVIRTLATLAHDCRRSELFQGELLAALQILQHGDLSQRDLIGARVARSTYHPGAGQHDPHLPVAAHECNPSCPIGQQGRTEPYPSPHAAVLCQRVWRRQRDVRRFSGGRTADQQTRGRRAVSDGVGPDRWRSL